MTDLEMKALKNALKIAEDYPLLVASGKPRDILMLFQKCYMEGYIEGMKHAHKIDMKAINEFGSRK